MALLKIIMKLLLEKEQENPSAVFDLDFIKDKTKGYNEFVEDLENHSIVDLLPQTGLQLHEIKEAAEMIATNKKDHHLLGHGIDSTQECSRQYS